MRERDRYSAPTSAASNGLPARTREGPGVWAVRASASASAASAPAASSAPSCSGLRTGFCARSGDGQVRAYNSPATASTSTPATASHGVPAGI